MSLHAYSFRFKEKIQILSKKKKYFFHGPQLKKFDHW